MVCVGMLGWYLPSSLMAVALVHDQGSDPVDASPVVAASSLAGAGLSAPGTRSGSSSVGGVGGGVAAGWIADWTAWRCESRSDEGACLDRSDTARSQSSNVASPLHASPHAAQALRPGRSLRDLPSLKSVEPFASEGRVDGVDCSSPVQELPTGNGAPRGRDEMCKGFLSLCSDGGLACESGQSDGENWEAGHWRLIK